MGTCRSSVTTAATFQKTVVSHNGVAGNVFRPLFIPAPLLTFAWIPPPLTTDGGWTALSVLVGSAVNQDGRSSSLTAPNGPSQQEVVQLALRAGGLEPGAVGHLQMHGTGVSGIGVLDALRPWWRSG